MTVLIFVGVVPKPKLQNTNKWLTVLSLSSQTQWISLDSLRVGFEGNHHTFTYVSGAHHKQGTFRRNLEPLGLFAIFSKRSPSKHHQTI
jgi:hypothetical protein